MSASATMTPVAMAASTLEAALVLSGIALAWRWVARKGERDPGAAHLGAWQIQPVDFACYLCFAFVGATSLSAVAGQAFKRARLDADHTMVAGGAVMHLGILLGLFGFFLAYRGRAGAPKTGNSLANDVKSGLGTFLIGLPVVTATSIAWEYLITLLGLPDDKQDMVSILQNSQDKALVALLVAVATLVVPLSEEMVFRAGLFRYFRTRVPRWAAILATSVLFGALHMSWTSFAPLTVLAVIFCLAYERTGSIRTTMVAHALFNLNTFIFVVTGLSS